MIENIFDNTDVTNNSEQIKILKKHFPQFFDREGAFNFGEFKTMLGEEVLSFTQESYQLNWLGKSYARLLANEKPRTLISADKAHNAKPENAKSQNLLIKGDNLEVLKHLKNAYSEKIKMIYIDPPYNTGGDGFVYQDDRKFTVEELSELAHIDKEEAKRILEFTERKSNSHSAWLTFMYPRLYIARELLREDGVIFISIDDNEQAQLKVLCDEIFGEENFIGSFIREAIKGGSKSNFFREVHDYVLVYSKEIYNLEFGGYPRENLILDKKDANGPYTKGRELNKWGAGSRRVDAPGMWYPIKGPNGEDIYPIRSDGSEGRWRFGKKSMERLLSNNNVIFEKKEDGRWVAYEKLRELKSKYTQFISILKDNYINAKGTDTLKNLFNTERAIFDYSKPTELVRDLILLALTKNSIVLDFFSGSGTTAHAVMELNAEDEGNRQFINVQLAEKTDEKSEAYKAGYHTIFDITKARIEKVGEKIKAKNPDYQGDLGFQIYETLPLPERYHIEIEELNEKNQDLFEDIKHFDEQELKALLTTWALYDRIPLTEELKSIELADYTAFYALETLYLMEKDFSIDATKVLLEKLDKDEDFTPKKIVIFGENFSSKSQRELSEALNSYRNRKSIEIRLIKRY